MAEQTNTRFSESTPTWTDKHVLGEVQDYIEATFASRYTSQPLSKYEMPQHGAPARVVYQIIKDLRMLDSTPRLNLASFVTTWMEDEANKLIMESINVNYVDTEEYPSSTEIQNNCVEMLARLTHSPAPKGKAVGAATVGSSEAILLGGLALKKRWQESPRVVARAKDNPKPNLVMGAQVHLCWDKLCRYFDIEPRKVALEAGRYTATPELMKPLIDENTIGVVGVLGSTYNGEFEDIQAIDAMLGELNKGKGWDVKIHVDGASGGFVAPFLYPDLEWDFQLENVASVNLSGHKYGMVYPGLGWVVWRDEEHLPESMCFYGNYLGSVERSVTLNFSKPASNIVAQYYQFLRLGFEGYKKIMTNLKTISRRLAQQIVNTGHFELLSKDVGVPLVAFRLLPVVGPDGKKKDRLYDEYDVAERLRIRGWVVPAYSMPANAEAVKLLRVTVRECFSMQMVELLVRDLVTALNYLDTHVILNRDELARAAEIAEEAKLQRPC